MFSINGVPLYPAQVPRRYKADDGSAKLPGLHDEGLAEIIRAAFPEVVVEDEKKDSEEEKKVEDKEETSASTS